MEELIKILAIGFSILGASAFMVSVVLLIHLGMLNRTLHQIKEHISKKENYSNSQGDRNEE